jgi:hypothetical protein
VSALANAAGRRAATALAVAAGCLAALAAPAQASTAASMRASFLPDRLGANTTVTLAFTFSGGEEGVPAPLSAAVLRLPAGLGIDLRGVRSCAPSRLQRKGASGCPSASLLGRGRALLEVHAGSQTVPEEAAISVFRGVDQGGRSTFEIFGHGQTPLDQTSESTAVLTPDASPFGSRLVVSIPPIPTLMYEPNASFVSLSLTIGRAGHTPTAHAAGGSIAVPRRCPVGGFPFAATFTFADSTTANAGATIRCP